jgi:hypothetical protein
MTETADDLAVPTTEIPVLTFKALGEHPELLAAQDKAIEGILEAGNLEEFVPDEMVVAAALVLGEEAGAAAGGAAAEPSITAHQRRALALAVSQKGPKELLGRNCNPYSRYFGLPCQEWCADFVSYCVDRTGNQDKKLPWGPPSWVPNITDWGQKNRRLHSQPMKGDIFTRQDGGHTGFVTRVNGSSFMTIEGNTTGPDGNPDHAVYVYPHQRDASSGLYYFVRWHF